MTHSNESLDNQIISTLVIPYLSITKNQQRKSSLTGKI